MTARVLEPTSANLALAAQALREGELVAMPTETVYGLAAGVFLPAALARVFAVKERPTFDPLIVHVSPQANSLEALAQLELIDLPAITPSHRKAVKRLIEAL